MTEIIKFIGWWWKKQVRPEAKTVITVLSVCIIFFSGMFIFGPKFVLITVVALISVLFLYGMGIFIRHITESWEYFQEIRESEKQEIIDRLKGTE